MNTNSYQFQPSGALQLLSAITMGTATVDDLAEELRRRGLPFSHSKLRTKTPSEIVSRIVQRVPQIPFILNGTTYDPKDITRFNGQELHFVPAPSGDHMLVVDNQGLIKNWLRLAQNEIYVYHTMRQTVGGHTFHGSPHHSGATRPQPLSGAPIGGHTFHGVLYPGVTQSQTPSGPSIGGVHPHFEVPYVTPPGTGDFQPELPGPTPSSSSGDGGGLTYFFEHIYYKGDSISLRPGRAYKDLTKIRMGIFGNWNDEISSVQMYGASLCRLYEHINWGGQTLNLYGNAWDLVPHGWNDRTSSIATW